MAITGIDTIDGKQIIAAGASSAVKAAQDSNGNNIASTYQTTAGMSNYQTTADMGDYATTADITGKQDALTFGYTDNQISQINGSGIYSQGGGGTQIVTSIHTAEYGVMVGTSATAVDRINGLGLFAQSGWSAVNAGWAKSAVSAYKDGNGRVIANTYQTTNGMTAYPNSADVTGTAQYGLTTAGWTEITGGGSTYSAGTGIDITDDIISVNSEYVPYLTITNNKNTSQVTYGDLEALCNGTKMFNLRYGNLIYYVARATSVASHCELIFSTPNTNTEYENYDEDLVYTKIKYYITIYFFPDDVTDSTVAYINGNNIKRVQLNIQPNWNETNTLSETYIQNKPSIPTVQLNEDNEVSAINNYPLAGGGSVQKREIEGDSAVSSISAIAGSALYCPLASLNTEGITDIQLVNELPVDPVSTVLYLIPEA